MTEFKYSGTIFARTPPNTINAITVILVLENVEKFLPGNRTSARNVFRH